MRPSMPEARALDCESFTSIRDPGTVVAFSWRNFTMNAILLLSLGVLLSGPADEMVVRVLTPEGEPLEGAHVHGEIEDPKLPVDDWPRSGRRTGSDGLARLALESGSPVQLSIEHRFYENFSQVVETRAPGAVEIRLPEPPWGFVEVGGRVLSPTGEPVQGAQIAIYPPRRHAPRSWMVTTDSDGWFAIPAIPEDVYRLELCAEGFDKTVEAIAVTEQMKPLDLRLRSTKLVVGQVWGSFGPELRNAEIRAYSADHSGYRYGGCVQRIPELGPVGFGQSVRGGFSGSRYSLRLPTGRWMIEASNPWPTIERAWRATVDLDITEKDGPVVEVDLEAEACDLELIERSSQPLAGRVLDAATSEPLPGATLRMGRQWARTDASGAFAFEDGGQVGQILAGHYLGKLEVVPPDGWASLRLTAPETAIEWLEIRLQRAVEFCYEFRWADGEPTYSHLYVYNKGAEQPFLESKPDRDGRGCIRDLAPGAYELSTPSMYWPHGRLSVSLPAEPLVLALPVLGGFELKAPELMRDHGFSPPAGTELLVERSATHGVVEQTLRKRIHRYLVGGIPPGRWLVTLIAPDGREWTGEVNVEAKKSSTVVVRRASSASSR